MLLIENGRVMDPASGVDDVMDVLVCGDRIAWMGKRPRQSDIPQGGLPGNDRSGESLTRGIPQQGSLTPDNRRKGADDGNLQVIDAAGMVVAPGLIDVHAHFRDPGFTWKEDIRTGAMAAAAGGYTTVVCMANTDPVIDSVERYRSVAGRQARLPVHVMQAAAVTKGLEGRELTDMEALFDAGAPGFTDDGIPVMDAALLLKAMKTAKTLGVPISLHEEDPAFIGSPGVNMGDVSRKLGIPGAAALAEETLAARDCLLALESGARVNIQHVSSRRTVEIIRFMKGLGADVWAEVTPQHFSLTEDAVLGRGALAKLNPPLRTEADRQALIKGLADGVIDVIATDHAPHSREEKSRDMPHAPSGMIGLETALALAITNLVRPGHMTLIDVLSRMTVKPAQLYGLAARRNPVGQANPDLPEQGDLHLKESEASPFMGRGRLEAGGAADIVIFDEKKAWTVTEGGFRSKSSNSPFIGMELYGKVMYTICGGKIVHGVRGE